MTTKIGILGSGEVGRTLANGFLQHGYEVMVGSRTPSKLSDWLKESKGKGKTGTFQEAAAYGDTIVLSVAGTAAESVVRSVASKLDGKTVIDTTNPIDDNTEPQNGVLKYSIPSNDSLLERLQRLAPAAHFVKAFNSAGAAVMVNPRFQEGKPTMFICGNSKASKKEVSAILELFSWEVADMGVAEAARAIEPLSILWCIPGFLHDQWAHAFKLLKPSPM